jgi:WD40 repeat protein
VVTAGDDDQTVRIWDTENLSEPAHVLTQARGRSSTNFVTFSGDAESRRVALATADGLVYVWDRRSGRLLATVRRHADYISEVAFDPQDIDRLVSGSHDYLVTSYICDACKLSSSSLADAARERTSQIVTPTKPAASEARGWTVPLVDFDPLGSG